jgi:ATP-dependent DNA helicase RecG
MHLVEQVGSGVGSIKDLMKGAELPDPIFLKEGFFTVIFQRPARSSQIGSQKGSQKSSQKIIEMILENASISTNEMAEIIGISRRAVAKQIAKLKKQ